MLEDLFIDPTAAQRMRRGYLGSYLDSYGASLQALGYARSTIKQEMFVLAELGRWMKRRGIAATAIDGEGAARFLDWRKKKRGYQHSSDRPTVTRFVDYLQTLEDVPVECVRDEESPIDRLGLRYFAFLKSERGLASVTISGYWSYIERFLRMCYPDETLDLSTLRPSHVTDFITRTAKSISPRTTQTATTALRSFLRFLLQYGEISVDLAACVPTVAAWRHATVPKYL